MNDSLQSLIRYEPVKKYIENIYFSRQLENEFHLHHLRFQRYLPVIYGNKGTGKTMAACILAQAYYDLSYTDNNQLQDYSDKLPLFSKRQLYHVEGLRYFDEVYIYHQKGYQFVVEMSLDEFSNIDFSQYQLNTLYLPDFQGYELYELFEKICQENHISLSKEAAVSLKTFLLIYYRLHKTTSNIYFVRDIYEKINLNRCLRTQQTQISLEDVLKVIGG